MNYQKHYDLLVIRGKSRILEDYSEKHHVIPKCMGGDNSEDNVVKLTPEEHYLAHQLLVKIYPGNHKLVYAANMMSIGRPGNKQYGWIRRKFSSTHSKKMSGRTKETCPGVKAMSEKLTGRTKENHPGLKAMSEKRTGRTKENHPGVKATSEKLTGRTKDTCPSVKSMSEKLAGRTKETHSGLKSQSEKMSGRTKDTCPGVKATSEKLIGRTKETHSSLKSQSEKMSGRTKENCPSVKSMSEKLRILSDEQEKILFDMRENGISGKNIHEHLKSLGILIAYSSISLIYNRVKKEKLNQSQLNLVSIYFQ